MKCLVCGSTFDDSIAKCENCGFPVIGSIDDSPEARAKILQLAEEYRQKKWMGVDIYLQVYTNSMKGDQLVVTSREEVHLGNTKNLREGSILWYSEKFARLSQDCKLTLRLDTGNTSETKIVDIACPTTEEFWQVGLLREEMQSYRIAVGNDSNHTLSTAFTCP